MFKIISAIFFILYFVLGIVSGLQGYLGFNFFATLIVWSAGFLSSLTLYALGEIVDKITYIAYKDNNIYFKRLEEQNNIMTKTLYSINKALIAKNDDNKNNK